MRHFNYPNFGSIGSDKLWFLGAQMRNTMPQMSPTQKISKFQLMFFGSQSSSAHHRFQEYRGFCIQVAGKSNSILSDWSNRVRFSPNYMLFRKLSAFRSTVWSCWTTGNHKGICLWCEAWQCLTQTSIVRMPGKFHRELFHFRDEREEMAGANVTTSFEPKSIDFDHRRFSSFRISRLFYPQSFQKETGMNQMDKHALWRLYTTLHAPHPYFSVDREHLFPEEKQIETCCLIFSSDFYMYCFNRIHFRCLFV